MVADTLVTAPGLLLIALVSSGIIYPMVGLSHGGTGFATFLFALFMSLFVELNDCFQFQGSSE